MNKNNIFGMSIAFITTLLMWFLSKSSAYQEVNTNYLTMILLLFTTTVIIGLGMTKIFYRGNSEKDNKTSFKSFKSHKNDFIGNDFLSKGERKH